MFNILLQIVFLISTFFTAPVKADTYQIRGIVLTADKKEPVANAYLYIVKGEEEALSNSKGEFTIITAEHLPFSLTVFHKDYKQAKIKVVDPSKMLTILMQHK